MLSSFPTVNRQQDGPMAGRFLFCSWLLFAGMLSCQSYDPITSSLCTQWCSQQKKCSPKQYANAFSHDRECEISCSNQWLFMGQNETPECEGFTKNLTVCLAELDCADFIEWKNRTSDETYTGPCHNETIGINTSCLYECTRDDHCAGWEYCDSGSCEPRPCNSAEDCPEGVWCADGVCHPL